MITSEQAKKERQERADSEERFQRLLEEEQARTGWAPVILR